MIRNIVMACVLAGVAGTVAEATTVNFRIVERQGQALWNPLTAQNATNDNILNLAVQAQVVGGAPNESLGNFGFDIAIPGESQANGTLFKAAISNSSGTFNTFNGPSDPPNSVFNQYANLGTVGRGGLSAVYSYLAGINSQFNGLINTTGGSFTDNPAQQDLGLVTGSPTGAQLLLLYDPFGNGEPFTYSGSGTTAPLDPGISNTYMGANGNWVDVYHFNYTISNNSPRVLNFTLNNAQAQTFTYLGVANGTWGPGDPTNAMLVSALPLSIPIVVPAPGAAALLGLGGLIATRRRRAA